MKPSPEHVRRRLDELINRCDVFLPPSERSLIKESRKARDFSAPKSAIAGAVLESSLRTLATSKGISWSGNSTISKLNTSLYSAGVYDKVVYGEIEAWGKLRNRVAHGDFETPSQIDFGSAERMIDGVQDFVLKFR